MAHQRARVRYPVRLFQRRWLLPQQRRRQAAPSTAGTSVNVNAGHAAATTTGSDAAASVAANSGTGAATGTASAPAVTVAPAAGSAAVTGSAASASLSVAPNGGAAAATGSASTTGNTVAVNAGHAAATGAAHNATVSTSAATNVNAGHAAATTTATAPAVHVQPSAGAAAATATGSDAGKSVAANAGHAAATGAASQATQWLQVSAGSGSATSSGHTAGSSVSPTAGSAAGSGTAHQPVFGDLAVDRFIAPTYRERRYAPTFYDALTGTRPIWLDPDVGTATTPDPGTLPNEFVFVAQVRGPNGDGTVNQCIVTQYEAEGQRSWFLRRNETNGSLNWGVTPTGNAAQAGQLTVAAQAITGAVEFLALAVTLDNGSSQRVVTSWRSLDNGVTWTSIATATGSVITPWDSTGVVRVGAFGAAGDRWDDRIYSVELRTGLDPAAGTVLWRFDATNYDGDGTAWTDPRGRTWTATSASALIYGAAPRHQAPTYRERRYVPAYRGEP